jgi:hypothetical protein
LRDAAGSIIGAIVVMQDVSETKRIEEELRSSRRWCTINKRLYNNGLDSEILA